MILADAHVHIYDCYNLERFLDAAYSNFQSIADRLGRRDNFTPVLLLTETEKDRRFDRFKEYADGKHSYKDRATKKWKFYNTGESESLSARSGKSKALFIIAGHQIETAEGLEVLALLTTACFRSGIPLVDLVEEVREQDAIPVIPWGFGKWMGRRGKILDTFLENNEDSLIFLGDNSGRPFFLPTPHHFKKAAKNGVHILPGSDPLPFANEHDRAGRIGFLLEKELSNTHPAGGLKQLLMGDNLQIQPYGRLESPLRFLHNQLRMQIKKQYSKHKV